MLSFNLDGREPEKTADALAQRGFALRGGLHCAPLMHRSLGTERTGAIRVSLSPHNTVREIKVFLNAVRRMTLS